MNTIALDFDAVIHTYTGWTGDEPKGKPLPGALEACRELAKTHELVVFTTRNVELVRSWLSRNGFDMIVIVTDRKPPWIVLLDDRAVCFNGSWDGVVDRLRGFKTYWEGK